MPPLREIKEDIPLLINYFLNKFNSRSKKKVGRLSPEAMDILLNYHWPGNVRQLVNVIERAFALGVNEIIQVTDLPSEIRKFGDSSKVTGTIYTLKENEIVLIKKALLKTGGKKPEAADLLGINTATLYRKIKRYGIPDEMLQNANYRSQFAHIHSA